MKKFFEFLKDKDSVGKIIGGIFGKKTVELKSTDKGYVNKNNQKNLGKTQLDGNDFNQKFYTMKCLNCNHEYFANGSDIWLKKCPNCQNGAKSSSVSAEFIEEFSNTPIGTVLTSNEIKSRINLHFGRNINSIIPSDYCYNRLNNGINYETHLHLFEYLDNNNYRYLGINYPYTGKILHNPKGGVEICVGELSNGIIVNTDKQVIENTKAVSSQSSASNNHKTKREVGITLRYTVLKRDSFKCCACGASPAKDSSVQLHIDHKIPWSKGGETTLDNLQTLCSKCNLGKSDLI